MHESSMRQKWVPLALQCIFSVPSFAVSNGKIPIKLCFAFTNWSFYKPGVVDPQLVQHKVKLLRHRNSLKWNEIAYNTKLKSVFWFFAKGRTLFNSWTDNLTVRIKPYLPFVICVWQCFQSSRLRFGAVDPSWLTCFFSIKLLTVT